MLIELKNIDKYYPIGRERLQVLHGVNLQIEQGEFVGIMGPSGSGKSTLVNILGFLDSKYDGEYLFAGKSVSGLNDRELSHMRNRTVGFVFQDFHLVETATIFENVQMPLLYAGMTAKKTVSAVEKALERVGIGEKSKQKPSQLSGGQKQRVAIARALINQPRFIIADEPTGAMDTKTSAGIMEILFDLNKKEKVTVVMVTHDVALLKYCSHQIKVVDGVVQKGTLQV